MTIDRLRWERGGHFRPDPGPTEWHVHPTLTIDRRVIAPGVAQAVEVIVELAPPPMSYRAGPPLDLVVVVEDLGATQDAHAEVVAIAGEVLARARHDDRIGIVAVHGGQVVLLPLGHHDSELAGRAIRTRPPGPGEPASADGVARGLLASSPRVGAEQRNGEVAGGEGAAERPAQAGPGVAARAGRLSKGLVEGIVEIEVLDGPPRVERAGGWLELAFGDLVVGEVARCALRMDVRSPARVGALELATLTITWESASAPTVVHSLGLPVTVRVV